MLSVFKFDESNNSKGINKYLFYLILGYIISIYIRKSPVITNIFSLIIFVLPFFAIPKKEIIKSILKNRINLFLILFFFLNVISFFYSKNKVEGFDILIMRIPFLAYPIAFSLIVFEKKTWNKILFIFALTTTLASIIGFAYGIYLSQKFNDTGYLYNDNISYPSLSKQAVYFAFYIDCAIFIFINMLINKNELAEKRKGLIILFIFWLIFINIMLACKTAMIALFLILISILFFQIIKNKKIFEGVLLIFGLAIFVFLLKFIAPKTLNRFHGLTKTEYQFNNKNKENHFNSNYDATKWNSTNTRIAIWKCSKEVWYNNFIFGTGIGDRNDVLKEKYKEKNFILAYETNKNTHNQYLDIAVSMGIAGLCFFIFVFIFLPLKVFYKNRNVLGIIVIICLAICFITENLMNRQQGVMIISFLIPLLTNLFEDKNITTALRQDTY